MESMGEIGIALSRLSGGGDVRGRFEKEALVLQHEIAAVRFSNLRESAFTSHMSVAGPRQTASMASLQHLRPIRLAELSVDCVHGGRVLFGTLCVNPFAIVGAMTVLEDEQGLAARVGIYNVPRTESSPAAINAKYPKGAKVAIKEPYLKQALDGGLAIRVENPADLVMVENPTEEVSQDLEGEYDISCFLLGMQPAGQFGDFIGDVEVKKTRGDSRGRGLFATKRISTGELVVVSNAVAMDGQGFRPFKFYRRPESKASSKQKALEAAIISAAEKSQKLLHQLYALDDGSVQVRASTPAMDLFDSKSCWQETTEMQINKQRIRKIVFRNSMGGEAELPGSSEGFSGLWVVPSFINHSCIPNATRIHAGRAMFLHAAKPIGAGEEITMSYFDALVPFPQREGMSQAWGFKCNCSRCSLEKRLKAFKSLNEQFEALHNDALQETNAARLSGEEFPMDLPKSAEFGRLYENMENILRKYSRMKAEEKYWIRASYVTAFWAGTQSNEFFEKTIEDDSIPSGDEILEAVVNTVPGDLRTLAMAAHQAEGLKSWVGNEGWAVKYSAAQARDACLRVLGKHKEGTIEALIQHHAKSAIF